MHNMYMQKQDTVKVNTQTKRYMFHECSPLTTRHYVFICYACAEMINYCLCLKQQKSTLTREPGMKAIPFTSETAELFSPIRSG